MNTKLISIPTPDGLVLNGFVFGPNRPRRVYIFIHGLGGSLFSRSDLTTILPNKRSAVLVFNNRGYGMVNYVATAIKKKKNKRLYGWVHEVFKECVYDLDGAISYAKSLGAKEIILVGHSTGCQKSVYYLAQRPRSAVKGAVLLAPMSDYSDIKVSKIDRKKYRRALTLSRALVKAGKKHELLPFGVWEKMIDAQRFLSLFTPDSTEEIFGYASGRKPTILNKARKPLLVVLAEEDEFRDRPTNEIAGWFSATLKKQRAEIKIISGAKHFFSPQAPLVRDLIAEWAEKIKK